MAVETAVQAIGTNGLSEITLLINLNETGPSGPDPYNFWLSQGNTGTVQDFFRAWAANARPAFKHFNLLSSSFTKKV